jgi:hypothetical protein
MYFIDYVSLFHLIPLIAGFSISAILTIKLIVTLFQNIECKPIVIEKTFIIALLVVGFAITISNININYNSMKILAADFVYSYLNNYFNDEITIIADPSYIWVPKYNILNQDNRNHHFITYYNKKQYLTDYFLLVVDGGFRYEMNGNTDHAKRLQSLYNTTKTIKIFNDLKFDEKSLLKSSSLSSTQIEIRTNLR